ncbi:MAG: UpxY family transcription antiterminator [Saprospiraceae bacterium]
MTQTPKSQFDQNINQLSNLEKRWFAIYTKYKCEKYVSEHLQKKGITSYVPIITKRKRYQRKIKHYQVPLINCYVFVFIYENQYLKTLETEYVLKFLRNGKDLLSIPQIEIDVLRRVVGEVEDIELNPLDKSICAGDLVEITTGQLIGLKGKVIKQEGKHNFLIDLETIGFQLKMQVEGKLLRQVHSLSY